MPAPAVSVTGADQLVPSTWAGAQCRPPSSETSTRSPAAGAASSEPEKTWLATLVTKSVLEAPPSFDSARLVKVRTGGVLSICTVRPADMAPVLPAASVAWAVMRWLPSFSLLLAMRQVPSTATALPSTVPPSYRVTVAPASAVPVKTGMVSAVMLSLSEMPLSELALRSGTDGAAGAVVSIVTFSGSEAALVLPAVSVALTVSTCVPLDRVGEVIDQRPSLPAMTEPSAVLPSYKMTVVPASAMPLTVGVASFVMLSPKVPLSLPAFSTGVPGLAGAVVSMVTNKGAEKPLVLLAASVAVTLSTCGPAAIALTGVIDHLPALSAVAEPSKVSLSVSYSLTVAPASAVPVKAGRDRLVMPSAALLPVSLPMTKAGAGGTAGGVESAA